MLRSAGCSGNERRSVEFQKGNLAAYADNKRYINSKVKLSKRKEGIVMKSRKSKRWLSAFLAACLMLGAVGCGGPTAPVSSGGGTASTASGSGGGEDLVRGGVGDGK